MWDTSTGASVKTLKGHQGPVRAVVFSPDGTRIVSGSEDCTVRMWDTSTGAAIQTLESNWTSVRAIAIHGLYCSTDGWVYKTHGTHIMRLCWVPVSCRPECQDSYKSSLALCLRGRTVILHF
ncbi:WD40-repeat-containing domain protein, partial [Russula earlei]